MGFAIRPICAYCFLPSNDGTMNTSVVQYNVNGKLVFLHPWHLYQYRLQAERAASGITPPSGILRLTGAEPQVTIT